MCETASAVSSVKIGGVSATTSFHLAAVAATAAVLPFSEAYSFNVITSRNSAIKNNTNSNINLNSSYINQSAAQASTYSCATTKFFQSENPSQELLSKTIPNLLCQKETTWEEKSRTSEIVNSSSVDQVYSHILIFNKNLTSLNIPSSGFSTIINESDFPHLGVRWSPSLSGATTVDTLSSTALSDNNNYNTLSMHGGLVSSSTSSNIIQQQTSLQNALFNRESGLQLNRPYGSFFF